MSQDMEALRILDPERIALRVVSTSSRRDINGLKELLRFLPEPKRFEIIQVLEAMLAQHEQALKDVAGVMELWKNPDMEQLTLSFGAKE